MDKPRLLWLRIGLLVLSTLLATIWSIYEVVSRLVLAINLWQSDDLLEWAALGINVVFALVFVSVAALNSIVLYHIVRFAEAVRYRQKKGTL